MGDVFRGDSVNPDHERAVDKLKNLGEHVDDIAGAQAGHIVWVVEAREPWRSAPQLLPVARRTPRRFIVDGACSPAPHEWDGVQVVFTIPTGGLPTPGDLFHWRSRAASQGGRFAQWWALPTSEEANEWCLRQLLASDFEDRNRARTDLGGTLRSLRAASELKGWPAWKLNVAADRIEALMREFGL